MLQLQELGLAATVINTLDNEGEPNQTWTLIDLAPERTSICCGWIYKAIKNKHGAVYHLKSRLVAKGHSQKPGID